MVRHDYDIGTDSATIVFNGLRQQLQEVVCLLSFRCIIHESSGL